jgi:hypothetical protein
MTGKAATHRGVIYRARQAVRAVALAITATLFSAIVSLAADPWEGTWVGDAPDAGSGVQLIFAGNNLVGFFWAGDYIDMRAAVSKADGVVSITWTRGQAILTREGPALARLQVFQRNQFDMVVMVRPED